MKLAALLIAATLALGMLWLAGEQHRENCIRSGQSSCSVLPWDNGEPPSAERDDRPLTQQECQDLRIDNALSGSPGDLPRECGP
jgi:hypothetical protein